MEGPVDVWNPLGSWYLQSVYARSGSFAWNGGSIEEVCDNLIIPDIKPTSTSQLQFWTIYSIEEGFDGGIVLVSTDNGLSFDKLDLTPPYPGETNMWADYPDCELGPEEPCFNGESSTWTQYTADLSPYDGLDIWIVFLIATDFSFTYSGWYIDDVTVTDVYIPVPDCDTTDCADPVPIHRIRLPLILLFAIVIFAATKTVCKQSR
jgi:hypothetical protein